MPLQINGATSGSTTIQATDSVTATLTLPSSTGTLVSTASPASGNVIQVVNATYSTIATNSTTTNADSGLTASITPKFSTSKILVIVNMAGLYNGGTASLGTQFQLIRNSTNIIQFARYTNYATGTLFTQAGTNYLDSPATTSSTTYKVQFCKSDGTAGTVSVQQNSDTSTITLMEIAA